MNTTAQSSLTSQAARRQRRVRRFTLLEAIAVVVVIGILAASTARLVSAKAEQTVYMEAATLRAHLRYAQSRAMAGTAVPWAVLLEADRHTLYCDGSPCASGFPGANSATHMHPAPVTVTRGLGGVAFDHWGSPGETDVEIDLSDGTRTITVTVHAGTGFVQ